MDSVILILELNKALELERHQVGTKWILSASVVYLLLLR